ncbi:aminotransferase class IV [Deinococcus deserti]|uniref:Aminotransferase class IV n=1 Tax=Deinococcus deserti (strain DSM 17065 / CIP 109153 / LMG 22923 / VCD115) TaxID=546414 RepID=C1CX93_DEIDV|nr:aminotransferase class IV [Deinococcus deserti]ACO46810.1 hypothetical protein Deide_18230 [Deinococcus deserti VCD115]
MKLLPVHLNRPSWLHGATAFTTVRTRYAEPLHWAAHLGRLQSTCAFLGLSAPDPELPVLDPLPWGLARVTVTEAGTFLSHRLLQVGPRPEAGVQVRLTGVQVHPQLALHKTGNYLPYRLAMQAADGAFEGWLQDSSGRVVDGSRTSPLLRLNGQLVVPAGGLPSVTRAAYLSGQEFIERSVQAEELSQVTAAWVCGSGTGVVPVSELHTPAGTQVLSVHWPELSDPALLWPGTD